MNWKASCSDLWKPGISRPLLRENFRRFWPIPVLAFLFYFLAGPFMILMNYGDLDSMRYMIRNMLNDNYWAFIALHLLVPVISAVTVFRYLQQPGAVTTSHALPFSRSTLFNTNFLSGFLMAGLPALANGLILLLIKRPVYASYYAGDSLLYGAEVIEHAMYPDGAYNVFSSGAVIHWILFALLTILFIYTITVFAGIVTGVSILHFGFGLWFNFLLSLMWLCLLFYFDLFLFGFDDIGSIAEIMFRLNPLLSRANGAVLGIGGAILFLLAIVLITFLSKWFYFNRPMERVGDALTFRFMQPLLNYLMAFMSMTLFGLYFDQNFSFAYSALLGIIIGAVLGFIIGRMVVTKTLLIFNSSFIKSFAVYVVLAALLMGSFSMDLYGFEKRIPKDESIVSAYIPIDNMLRSPSPADFYTFEDPTMISYITDIHRELLQKRNLLDGNYATKTNLSLRYTLDNGWEATRRYPVSYEFLYSSQSARAFFHSPERRQMIEESYDRFDDILYISFYNQIDFSSEQITSLYPTEYDLDGLIDAMKQDALEMTYAESLMEPINLLTMDISYQVSSAKNNVVANTFHLSVTPQMEHTIHWFYENGICDPLNQLVDLMAAVVITPYVWNNHQPTENISADITLEQAALFKYDDPLLTESISLDQWDGDTVYSYDPLTGSVKAGSLLDIHSNASSDGSFVVTDPQDIRSLLSVAESRGNYNRNLFHMDFHYKFGNIANPYRYHEVQIVQGTLSLSETKLHVSPKLSEFMNSAF